MQDTSLRKRCELRDRMATPGKAVKKEKKKPIPVKTSLNNPYDLKWTPLEKGNARYIISKVKEKLDSLGLQKRRVTVFRKWGNRRKSQSKSTEAEEPLWNRTESGEPTTESAPVARGWSDAGLRKQLAVGINEVTKALERNELSLVLVCDSVKPPHMICHIIPLSKSRSAPACQVPNLSASISESLGIGSVLALGFRRSTDTFADLVADISPKVPELQVDWLFTDNQPTNIEREQREDFSPEAEQSGEVAEKLSPNPVKSCKRKLDGTEHVPLTLQPLKVKKIIPNPTKIRKPKIKKAKKK